uniref:PAS domain-containing protein n=1 Tax=Clostridium sp. NkU-1 TaxID=1095009 RepID=UPI000B20528B
MVLHSLEDTEHSVIKIINGHHTGRTEGMPITDLALLMLEEIEKDGEKKLYFLFYQEQKRRTVKILYHCGTGGGKKGLSAFYVSIFT